MAHKDDNTNLRQYSFDLVSARDEEENHFITKLLNAKSDRNPYKLPWIGLYKNGARSWDEPKWKDGSFVLYTKWAPNAPEEYKVSRNVIMAVAIYAIHNLYTF